MMGGKISHEFMLLTPVGEDSIVVCKNCDFKANVEAAECIVRNGDNVSSGGSETITKPIAKVRTPDMKTIDDVCEFLGVDVKHSCKAVVYQKETAKNYVVVFLRGDLEINEVKLRNYLGCEIYPAILPESTDFDAVPSGGLAFGFIGPYNMSANGETEILFDNSLIGAKNLCCGANEVDYHYTGLYIERDIGAIKYNDFAKAVGGGVGICPQCGEPSLDIVRGIEVGNIFQLGKKYTETMNMQFTDKDGESHYPVMGCYGIGVGRLAASVCEARHDEYGPAWPISIAPWQVHICSLRADDANVKTVSDNLYGSLIKEKIEVIYDDRSVSAGSMFSDADLLGVPIRVVVSPRNLSGGCVEIVTRDKSISRKARLEDAVTAIHELIGELKSKLEVD
jgi:prolyl-tRNA synthetase